ncbi:MBL fold metallo-hydrolase [Deinococcus irradiatisoli]|uniref:MBL fold metallo-hydrolase n=1 Tax=Deinococcus irradiatisoli TaxID=2202254 RepID=A0A2Z3JIX6_9DEIO|nr:MBL fold metallo-hydrolase [Deinococcus irradiatisoli]AWN23320.1 MBL fold metallo-hydrolase [Deinococcus irradiatisoli]
MTTLPSSASASAAAHPSEAHPSLLGGQHLLTPDLVRVRLPLSNVFLLGTPGTPWVLIDAGHPGSTQLILRAVSERFGSDARPQAIVLTHGHLDHIGALHALLERWGDVPVYAHALEQPYLSGQSAYPPPDPSVGGSMSAVSPVFLPGPYDFRPHLRDLADLGDLPALQGWEVIETPGHTPGHVSLWRGRDKVLIAGDAFVTTVQEDLGSAMSLRPQLVHRPPAYYTPDWDAAKRSVAKLAALEPELAVTGHGDAMQGRRLQLELRKLATNFDEVARPRVGRYARQPAITDASGVRSLPPARPTVHGLFVALAALGLLMVWNTTRPSPRRIRRGRLE